MPFGGGFAGLGGFYSAPQQAGLGFGDLYRPTPRPRYPEEPDWIDSTGELGEEERRRLRRQALLLAAQALAGGGGETGGALAQAAGLSGQYREETIARARQEQEGRYRAEREQAERQAEEERFDIAEQERAGRTRALLAVRDKIVEADPALADQAETALALGNMSELQQLLAAIPRRQAMRAAGANPDDPFADDEARARIQTEAEEARRERELEDLPRQLGLRSFYDLEERRQMRDQGLLWEPDRPPREPAPHLQRFEHGGQQYTFDPRTGQSQPVQGMPGAAAGADPLWTKAVEQAQRERAQRHGKINVEERARRLYEIYKNPPPPPNAPTRRAPPAATPGAARRAPAPSHVTEPGGAPMGPGGTIRRGGGAAKVSATARSPLAPPAKADPAEVADVKQMVADVGLEEARRILRKSRGDRAESLLRAAGY